ncbi:MBL fold metallo-hydrolase [Halobacteriales archaeon QS_8_69_26]|nr:MAG: MBL fold metallo-hydrolase [Halobacteriales archaeon QS_8_69_26]
MALTEGVHALPLEYEFEDREMTIHPAAVETDRGVILLDAGLPGSVEQISDGLAAAGLALSDVTKVLLTHHDGDHAGGLRELVDETGAEVLAHREEAPHVDGREAPVKGDADDRYPPVVVDVELVGSVRFRTAAGPMDVVDTPGHAPGHVSLFFPRSGLLVAGDALVSEGGELSGPKPEFTPEMDRAMESVGALAHLDVERTHCYHGGTVEAGTGRIEEIYEDER